MFPSSKLLAVLSESKLADLAETVGYYDFMPRSSALRELTRYFCDGGGSTWMCDDVIFALCGRDDNLYHNLNDSRVSLYTNWIPAGTSVRVS